MRKLEVAFHGTTEGHNDKQEVRIKLKHSEEEEKTESEKITKEEVIRQLFKLKKEKAPGCDEIRHGSSCLWK